MKSTQAINTVVNPKAYVTPISAAPGCKRDGNTEGESEGEMSAEGWGVGGEGVRLERKRERWGMEADEVRVMIDKRKRGRR